MMSVTGRMADPDGTTEIKKFLHSWLGSRHCGMTESFKQSDAGFICELMQMKNGISKFMVAGKGGSKKEAKTEAAWEMARHLILRRQLTLEKLVAYCGPIAGDKVASRQRPDSSQDRVHSSSNGMPNNGYNRRVVPARPRAPMNPPYHPVGHNRFDVTTPSSLDNPDFGNETPPMANDNPQHAIVGGQIRFSGPIMEDEDTPPALMCNEITSSRRGASLDRATLIEGEIKKPEWDVVSMMKKFAKTCNQSKDPNIRKAVDEKDMDRFFQLVRENEDKKWDEMLAELEEFKATTISDLDEAKAETEEAKAEIERMNADIEKLKKENADLREENAHWMTSAQGLARQLQEIGDRRMESEVANSAPKRVTTEMKQENSAAKRVKVEVKKENPAGNRVKTEMKIEEGSMNESRPVKTEPGAVKKEVKREGDQ